MQDWYRYTLRREVANKLIEDKGFIKKDGLKQSGVVEQGMKIETSVGDIKVIEVFSKPDSKYGKFIAIPC